MTLNIKSYFLFDIFIFAFFKMSFLYCISFLLQIISKYYNKKKLELNWQSSFLLETLQINLSYYPIHHID